MRTIGNVSLGAGLALAYALFGVASPNLRRGRPRPISAAGAWSGMP